MFTLKAITKRRNHFLYHIEVNLGNTTHFVEMRKNKLSAKGIYLMCTSLKCTARLSLTIKPEITIEKIGSVFKYASNVTESQILDVNNYGKIFHHHHPRRSDERSDGTCRMIRHAKSCLKKICQDRKRKYREELTKITKQNPAANAAEIMRIVNKNLNLLGEEQEQIQPIDIFKSVGINLKLEQAVIWRKRNLFKSSC